jgi:host factor-I protein
METNLLDRMLDTYLQAQTSVTVTLQNKIRVTGKIKVFDSYVIIIENSKREIVYRHAISSITPYLQEEQRHQPAPSPNRPAVAKIPSRTARTASRKPGPTQPQAALSAAPGEQSLNNGMKEGLLKWMQEQKAAK